MFAIDNYDFKGKRAIIRVDFNVPLNEKGEVTDDTRIRAAIPTIKKVLEKGGSVILMSHLGRPKKNPDPKFSLEQIVPAIEKRLGVKVMFAGDCMGEKAAEMAKNLKPGEVMLLENLRFYAEEEGKPRGLAEDATDEEKKAAKKALKEGPQKEFVKKLASYADCYINDAFGTAHRAHASTALIADYFPNDKMFGYVMENELKAIDGIMLNPERPFCAILGGSKVSTKITIIENLLEKVDVLVLGGGSMKKFGFVDKALGYLKEAGIETRLIENVEPDPSVETVMSGAAVMREFEPDWIISMGGGSPIDAAKAMWAFYEYPETTFEDLITPFSFPELRQKARFCAIPSTSGTATEVTAFSVITDYQKGIKYPLADFNITPDVAIIDPALAETMPPKLVAHTGMDALTHAIEAYVSTLHTVFTDPLALKAIHIVEKDLLRSFNGDMGCREEMHYGQCLAGMAFSNALLGIVHSMAHKTGAAFSTGHITHGLANAMYLPYVIAYNAKADGVAERYADIARTMGVVGDTTAELVEGLRAKIRSMNDAMGIPNTLKDFGIIEDEFKEKLDVIAANAVGDACTGSNPRPIDPATMAKLFTCIYYGTEVDF